MKILRGHIVVVSICALAFLFVAGRKVTTYVSIPQKSVCIFDSCLSYETKKQICSFVEHADPSLFCVMSEFDSVLKQQFPYIKSIQTRLVPPATIKVSCFAYEPCYGINNTHLIVVDNARVILCPMQAYKKEICTNVPQATVDMLTFNMYTAQELYALLSQLPKDIFAEYRVHIAERDTLLLHDNKQPNLTLVIRAGNDLTLLAKCGTYTRELLESRKAFNGKPAAHYTADLRFEKQIILSKK